MNDNLSTEFKGGSYLNNEICEFQPLFTINPDKKQNILSVTLFKTKHTYKPFDIYTWGLKKLNTYVATKMSDFRIRLFIDQSIYNDRDLRDFLEKLDKTDMVLYKCSGFMMNELHEGLFGTLVRFFPMFDFENNDANIVGIMDADFKASNAETYYYIYNNLKKYEERVSDFKNTYLFYYGKLFHPALKHNNANFTKPYAVAPKVFNVKRINSNVLIKYLLEVKNKSGNYIYSDYDLISQENVHKITDPNTNFIFGVDEYFINNVLLEYLRTNKLCYAARYYYQLSFPLFYKYNKDPTSPDIIKILDFILCELSETSSWNSKQKFNFIDKKTYFDYARNSKPKIDKVFYYLNYRIYLMYAILRKSKSFDVINKNISDLIFQQNFGLILIEKVESVNCIGESEIIYKNIELPSKYMAKICKVLDDDKTLDLFSCIN